MALLGVASITLVTLLTIEGRRARSTWILAHAAVGLAFLPWFLVVVGQVAKQSTVLAWFTPYLNRAVLRSARLFGTRLEAAKPGGADSQFAASRSISWA